MSVNAQDEHDQNLIKVTDKYAKKCKGMVNELTIESQSFDIYKLISDYMQTATDIRSDTLAIVYQLIDHAMQMCLAITFIAKAGTDLKQLFSYGDEGDALRARLTKDDFGLAESVNDYAMRKA